MAALMAETPPRTLKRSMRVVGALLLTLSAITPATSVFVIVPEVFQQAGTGAFISMAATAFVSLSVAFVYAELSSAFPIAGGEYSMVGKTLGPAAGFATLALTALGNMLAPAVFALGAAPYLAALYPGLEPRAVAVAIIVSTTLLGVLHIRTNAWVTGTFLLIELLALVVLAVLGFGHLHRPLSALLFHPVFGSNGALHPTTLSLIGFSAATSIFAYNGYGAAVYFSEEMHEAPRLVARTIMWALAITVATELIPVTAVLVGAPDIKGLLATADPASKVSPFSYFVQTMGGNGLNIAISLGIALAIINAVLATVMQNGRFFFSTGRDGTWHGSVNDALTRTHSRFNSPWVATLASGATAIATCFISMEQLLVLTGTGVVFVYLAVSLGVLIGRRSGSTDHAAYRMPFFPVVPIFAIAALAFIVYASWLDPTNGLPSLIVNAIAVALALAYYKFVLVRRKVWTLCGPADEDAQSYAVEPGAHAYEAAAGLGDIPAEML
jgi:amino acid transporter